MCDIKCPQDLETHALMFQEMTNVNVKYVWLLVALGVTNCIPEGIPTSAPAPDAARQPGDASLPQRLSPGVRAAILGSGLAVVALLLALCLVNVCAASPHCCPFDQGVLVDSDYSSESLAFLRWRHAPRTPTQRLARRLTLLLLPLRGQAFYRPSRAEQDSAPGWPGDAREPTCKSVRPSSLRGALLGVKCSGRCRGPCAPDDDSVTTTLTALHADGASVLENERDGACTLGGAGPSLWAARKRRTSKCKCKCKAPPRPADADASGDPQKRRGRHSHWAERPLAAMRGRFHGLGLPRTLLATPPDVSEKWLLKRLKRLERRQRKAEKRSQRMEARELGLMARDRERRVRRRDKEMRKQERKRRAQMMRQKKALNRSRPSTSTAPEENPVPGPSYVPRASPITTPFSTPFTTPYVTPLPTPLNSPPASAIHSRRS